MRFREALSLPFLTEADEQTQRRVPMTRWKEPPAKTGFVRVKEIEGVWWFVSPTGEPFLSLGVNHIEPHLWLGPYNREHTIAPDIRRLSSVLQR